LTSKTKRIKNIDTIQSTKELALKLLANKPMKAKQDIAYLAE